MKNIYTVFCGAFIIVILCLPTEMHSQNIGIGTATPHPSAALEIKSSSMGLLIPGMTQAQRNAISSPAQTKRILKGVQQIGHELAAIRFLL